MIPKLFVDTNIKHYKNIFEVFVIKTVIKKFLVCGIKHSDISVYITINYIDDIFYIKTVIEDVEYKDTFNEYIVLNTENHLFKELAKIVIKNIENYCSNTI